METAADQEVAEAMETHQEMEAAAPHLRQAKEMAAGMVRQTRSHIARAVAAVAQVEADQILLRQEEVAALERHPQLQAHQLQGLAVAAELETQVLALGDQEAGAQEMEHLAAPTRAAVEEAKLQTHRVLVALAWSSLNTQTP